jgi:hypothetical protein
LQHKRSSKVDKQEEENKIKVYRKSFRRSKNDIEVIEGLGLNLGM